MNSKTDTISDRAQNLLNVVVERYIRDGQPVGSKTLAEETSIGLSSATIRNVLSELEDLGYLRSPHTSAGRIPTAQGYRFFVNTLITARQLSQPDPLQLEQQFNGNQNKAELINSASNLLADLTRLAGLVMLPQRQRFVLRHVEFLPLTENRLLVVLVLNDCEVQNRIIYTDKIYKINELQQAANYLNSTYAGQDIAQIRTDLLANVQEERDHLGHLLHTTREVADKAFSQEDNRKDYVLAGHSHLLELAQGTDIAKVQQLFDVFTQKQDILHLLDKCLLAEGVQIFIGEESGNQVLQDCSLVTAPYSVNDQVIGVLGVIGPTRMSYDKVIPVVDITAKLLGAALNSSR